MIETFRGTYTVMVTAFNKDGQLDLNEYDNTVNYYFKRTVKEDKI